MLFKDIFFSSGSRFVQQSGTVSVILVEDIMRNIFMNSLNLALVGIQRSRMVCAILLEGIMRNISVNFF